MWTGWPFPMVFVRRLVSGADDLVAAEKRTLGARK
jgi:hypothetical protein